MFGTINIKVRPIKLAYLVDPRNQREVREAIRLSSSLWGGVYFPMIPLYRRMPTNWRDKLVRAPSTKSVILGYVEAFDPDILVHFSREVPSFLRESGLTIIRPTDVWEHLDDTHLAPQFGLGMFEILRDVFDEYFKYTPRYPRKVLIPQLPAKFALFWASLFGELFPSLESALRKYYQEPLDLQWIRFDPDRLGEVMAHNVLFPRRLTQWRLTGIKHSGFRRDAAVFFFDATKTADIIDFWNLRALGKAVLPVPKQLQAHPELKELVLSFLKEKRRHWSHDPTVCDYASFILARSCTIEEMRSYTDTLRIDPDPNDPSKDPFFSLQHWYPRIWEEWARDKDGAEADDIYSDEEKSLEIAETTHRSVSLAPVLPEFANKHVYHTEPRCANEVSFHFYDSREYLAEVFPKGAGANFTRTISGGLTSWRREWRVGRNGLVKLVRSDFTEARDVPSAESIVFSWLQDLGWKPQLSAPGRLAKEMYRRLDGHPWVLRNETVLGLLEHMNGGLVRQDGSPVDENRISQDRALPVAAVKSRLASAGERTDLYGYLLSKAVFTIGLRIKCPHCLRNSWYPTENVRDSVVCSKCVNSFPAVGNVDTAIWSYKTAGPFSVPHYADGAYAVVLTLEFFKSHRMSTLRSSPVLSFSAEAPGKKDLEADLGMFWQESIRGEQRDGLMFGECKTYGQFERQDFLRMQYLANTFPGAVLVFSTLRKSLTTREIVGIARIARRGRRYWKAERPINPVLVLTGTELLGSQGVPYCWEESVRKRFERVAGLLQLCDATQQLYLGLPSWWTDWRERWDKRRERGRGKTATRVQGGSNG